MISTVGNFSLSAAILVAVGAILASIYALRFNAPVGAKLARWGLVAIALCFTAASFALLKGILDSQFQFQYVADYTERALPTGYKYAAFWAGQAGSLLLWAWMLGVMCAMAAWQYRKKTGKEFIVASAVMALVCGFFAMVLILDSDPIDGYTNPFTLVSHGIPADGNGMNPMLQDPGMIFHPPLLFLGYAGFTVPFAVLVGVLGVGRRDNRWLGDVRRWVLASWVFLTVGIVLGAWWAYVELGWGGYWAWDPVENASLLPWLTATALLHSMVAQQHRGMFKFWNAGLLAGSFILCIFGTYLTRSGVIQSVHAFGSASIGTFFDKYFGMPKLDELVATLGGVIGTLFLVFLGLMTLVSLMLIILRRSRLKSEHQTEAFISREGAFLFGNLILVIMMVTTLLGTLSPIYMPWLAHLGTKMPILTDVPFVGKIFGSEPGVSMAATEDFYNKIVAPMGVLLAFIMAHGPLLAFGKSAPDKIIKDVTPAGLSALVVTVMTAFLWTYNPWALVTVFIASLGSFVVIIGFIKTVAARRKGTGESLLVATLRLIDADKRRYGAQIAHLGVMLIILGVVGSSLFKTEHHLILNRGVPTQVGDYALTLQSVGEERGPNYLALRAVVDVTGPSGRTLTLEPEKRRYDKWQRQINTEIALHSSLAKDVYLILGGSEPDGSLVSLQVLVSPLVVWIWLGGIVLAAGGIYAMLPRFLPRHAHDSTLEAQTPGQSQQSDPSQPTTGRMRPVSREAQEAETKK